MEPISPECDELTPVSIDYGETPVPRRISRRVSDPEPQYEEFLGMTAVIASPAMRRLLTATSKVARSNLPVLITGESGTGKELIARAVHHYSSRAAKPFIDVNCAALPEHLMESELFG